MKIFFDPLTQRIAKESATSVTVHIANKLSGKEKDGFVTTLANKYLCTQLQYIFSTHCELLKPQRQAERQDYYLRCQQISQILESAVETFPGVLREGVMVKMDYPLEEHDLSQSVALLEAIEKTTLAVSKIKGKG